MTPESAKKIQVVLAIAIAVAAIRTGYILYQRRASAAEESRPRQAPLLDPDYYVVRKKLHPLDLNSAKQLTQQPVWAMEGYRYTYYPYSPARHQADFSQEAGLLLPLERLEIKDVVSVPSPGAPAQRQIIAVFEKDGKPFAVPVGLKKGNDYKIYSDEMFFIQDPRQLYKHWSADVWESVEKHEVKLGMNEIQAVFAIGMGVPTSSAESTTKVVKYPNGGKPVTIIYRNGRASEINPG